MDGYWVWGSSVIRGEDDRFRMWKCARELGSPAILVKVAEIIFAYGTCSKCLSQSAGAFKSSVGGIAESANHNC